MVFLYTNDMKARTPASIIQLIAFALIPLVGVFLFGWDWREVLLLYWLENITVGIVTLIKIIRSPVPDTTPTGAFIFRQTGSGNPVAKIFLAGFYAMHYGMFTLVHGVFVFVIISFFGADASTNTLGMLGNVLPLWFLVTVVTTISAAVKGGHSMEIGDMLSPYKRIFALHISIILGVFAIVLLQLPSAAAILLIVFHAFVDLVMFKRPSLPKTPPPAVLQ